MSKSKANELIQRLYQGLQDNWNGHPTTIKCSEDAYKLCRQIIQEVDEIMGDEANGTNEFV